MMTNLDNFGHGEFEFDVGLAPALDPRVAEHVVEGDSLRGVHLDHRPEQCLAVGGHKVRNVEDPLFHLLQQISEIVVVERQRPDQQGV